MYLVCTCMIIEALDPTKAILGFLRVFYHPVTERIACMSKEEPWRCAFLAYLADDMHPRVWLDFKALSSCQL